MKRVIFYLGFAMISNLANAKTWLVDNNSATPGTLTDLPTAITLANNGDTIMVKASATNYGTITINKELTLIGENSNETMLTTVIVHASNVHLTGFHIYAGGVSLVLEMNNTPGGVINNFLLERCFVIARIQFVGGAGCEMHHARLVNNIIQNSEIRQYGSLHIDSLTFENNILDLINFADWVAVSVADMQTVVVRNNIFTRVDTFNGNTTFFSGYYGAGLHDAILYNNILIATRPQQCNGCTFYNNLTYVSNGSDVLPGNNPTNLSVPPLLVNYPTGAGFSYNYDYHLQQSPPSPCIGTGVGGTDMGIYGGYYPFNIGEGPNIPIIDFLNISNNAVPQGGTFYLQFDARVRK